MIRLLLVTPHKKSLFELASVMEKNDDVELTWTESGKKALDMLSETSVDLVVTDEELEYLKKIYYKAKGWTEEGLIPKQLLIDLGMDDVAEEIGV